MELFDIFPLFYHFSLLAPSLWETARCRLKYCLKAVKPKNNTLLLAGRPRPLPKIAVHSFALYCSVSAAVAASEEEGLSEGTVVGLACLFGAIFVGLVLVLTCFLVRLV